MPPESPATLFERIACAVLLTVAVAFVCVMALRFTGPEDLRYLPAFTIFMLDPPRDQGQLTDLDPKKLRSPFGGAVLGHTSEENAPIIDP